MSFSPSSIIPYGRQSISEADVQAVTEVLSSPFVTQGPAVPSFEKEIAKLVKAEYCTAFNSATSALHIACMALGLGPGDILWTSPITFVASANCARYCGAEVDFVDIEASTGLMSVIALKDKLEIASRCGRLPKIIIPVHLAGNSCDMESISLLADEYGFHVIEDASHAIGGLYKDLPVGNCKYSSITVFSFHPVKIITTGEGGAATTNDANLALKMSELRSHGIVRDQARFQSAELKPWSYEQQELGFNYRMNDIQAALGLSQLQRINEFINKRHILFNLYKEELVNMPLRLINPPNDVFSALHLAIIRLQDCDPTHHETVFKGLRSAGIGVQLHYMPVHLHPYYRRLGFHEGLYPQSEAYSNSAISLPIFPDLQQEELTYVVNALHRLLA
jgi:UDP-4-amino-4,6-dideoxy-N-acetyl-beta-L-altrosamine transaminase